MKLWVTLTILGFAYAQSANIANCPTFCECIVSGEATCTTLDIEPFPTADIVRLTLNSPQAPLDLSGPTFTNLRLTKLRELTITNATIGKLDASLFTTLNLDKFVVRHSKIPVINKQLLKASQYIRLVDLSYSNIQIFEGLESGMLTSLVLAGCNFTTLPAGSLSPNDLPALEYLNLENNQLQEIKLGDLAGEEISLANNKIFSLTITADEDVLRLTTLKLDNNPLKYIEAEDEVDLEALYVNNCHLTNLNFLQYFTSLIKLEARNNLIFSIDSKILNSLDALEVLDLSENLFKELPKDFGHMMVLTSLVLDKNNLKTLPKFMFQGTLDKFSCNECNLTELHPETFNAMLATRVISLANNNLATIPKDLFKPVKALVKVDLSHNKLTSLPVEIFQHNQGLKFVDINSNPLKEVDPSIFSKTSIKELHMDNCGLTKLWTPSVIVKEGIVLLPKLEVLTATNNNITQLTTDDLKIAKIGQLNIMNNPLICTDANINFINAMSKLSSIFLHSSDCDCAYDDSNDYTDPEVEDDVSKEIETLPEEKPTENKQKPKEIIDLDPEDDSMDESDEYDDDETIGNMDSDESFQEDIPKEQKPKTKKQEYDEFQQDVDDVSAVEFYNFQARQRSSKQMLFFVLPTVVFILTAMVVLLLTVTVILCVMQRRNGRPTNAPQITILPWGHGQKIKKHSGSIYRPLSEEKLPV
ncbi:toll-like receptor 3 [Atheta coriaria]|uniref:toll-like receptor 3 n=1 Tax=Dalotia coriaria TaxID=877792 RepID=UPI0031F3ECD6